MTSDGRQMEQPDYETTGKWVNSIWFVHIVEYQEIIKEHTEQNRLLNNMEYDPNCVKIKLYLPISYVHYGYPWEIGLEN